MFSRSGNPLLIFIHSNHVWVTSKIQVDFRFNTYLEVFLNVWHRFLKFWSFLGQGIQCDISTELPCLDDPKNLGQLLSDSRVTQKYWWLYLMDFYNFFTIYVVKIKETIADIPTELRYLSDLENPSQLPVWVVLVILSYEFLNFHTSCFRGQGIHCWYFYRATMFGWPRKSRWTSSSTGSRRYWSKMLSIYKQSRKSHRMVKQPLFYCQFYCHVRSRHVTSCHVMPCHVTSCHIRSCRKSWDGHATNALLSTDFFHTQLIQFRHNRFRCLSRRVPNCRYCTASAVYNLILNFFSHSTVSSF